MATNNGKDSCSSLQGPCCRSHLRHNARTRLLALLSQASAEHISSCLNRVAHFCYVYYSFLFVSFPAIEMMFDSQHDFKTSRRPVLPPALRPCTPLAFTFLSSESNEYDGSDRLRTQHFARVGGLARVISHHRRLVSTNSTRPSANPGRTRLPCRVVLREILCKSSRSSCADYITV